MAAAGAVEAIKAPQAQITAYVMFTCIMAGSGGLMYGYDLVIAGGISIMDDFLLKFYPTVYMHKKNAKKDNYCKYNNQVFQLFSSSLYLAALTATFFASAVSKKLGRKVAMLCAGLFYIFGTMIGTLAQHRAMLITGRALLGCGLGFANQAVPVYLSEIAPPRIRGSLNMLFGMNIAIGILSANIVNYFAAKVHPWGWRLSLGMAGIPSLLLTLSSLIIVETPSSLIERGKHEQARNVLRRIRGTTDVSTKLDELLDHSKQLQGSSSWEGFKEFFVIEDIEVHWQWLASYRFSSRWLVMMPSCFMGLFSSSWLALLIRHPSTQLSLLVLALSLHAPHPPSSLIGRATTAASDWLCFDVFLSGGRRWHFCSQIMW
ncbi:hypothetical protein L7F22_002507 [Adiantum nelumboides]|nr:hypothetical protein [Adiantum nelumboides]